MAYEESILICEDDSTLAGILELKLIKEGYDNVDVAYDGKKGRELLKDKIYDLVVADINMPHFSGLDVTHYVRKDLSRSTPIIIMSMEGQDKIVLEAYKLGANDFITKPIGPSEVILRVKKLLRHF